MEKSVGGNKWLHLQTNKVVKHQNLTKMPITMSIIKQVHALTTLDDMPQGLRIKKWAKNLIFDSALISGVDYYEEEFDNDKYNKEL